MGLKTVIISQKVTFVSELNTHSAKYVVEVWRGGIFQTVVILSLYSFFTLAILDKFPLPSFV